jgi:hypothetical protein
MLGIVKRLGPYTRLSRRQVHDRVPAALRSVRRSTRHRLIRSGQIAEEGRLIACLTPVIAERYKVRYREVIVRQSAEYCTVGLFRGRVPGGTGFLDGDGRPHDQAGTI